MRKVFFFYQRRQSCDGSNKQTLRKELRFFVAHSLSVNLIQVGKVNNDNFNHPSAAAAVARRRIKLEKLFLRRPQIYKEGERVSFFSSIYISEAEI
jgi:hypothetical protein